MYPSSFGTSPLKSPLRNSSREKDQNRAVLPIQIRKDTKNYADMSPTGEGLQGNVFANPKYTNQQIVELNQKKFETMMRMWPY